MLSVVMLNVFMLSVVMLSVVMLNVVAPCKGVKTPAYFASTPETKEKHLITLTSEQLKALGIEETDISKDVIQSKGTGANFINIL